jgi:fructosamine-3-kinase
MSSASRERRHPRRRRAFLRLSAARVRTLVEPVLGHEAAGAAVELPARGVNNETYLVRSASSGLAVRVRPRSSAGARTSAQWPLYVRRLFGDVPNGDLSTLAPATELLLAHGSIPVPAVYLADTSCTRLEAPYAVVELVERPTFDWEENRPGPVAADQLGNHLGRLHAATRGVGFGIFAARDSWSLTAWWERFASFYRTLMDELAATSADVAAAVPDLERLLDVAIETGPPAASVLVCHDQSPSHYVAADHGGIAALLDVEAHAWAPPDYELAMIELWLEDFDALKASYARSSPWPRAYDRVRGAYAISAWMEWAYCLHTLMHDTAGARALEARVPGLARGFGESAARAAAA